MAYFILLDIYSGESLSDILFKFEWFSHNFNPFSLCFFNAVNLSNIFKTNSYLICLT